MFQQEYEKVKAEFPYSSRVGRVFRELKKTLNGRPLVLYGAGRLTGVFLDYCNDYGLPVSCICDSYKVGVYSREDNLDFIDVPTLVCDYQDATVLICSSTYNDAIYLNLIRNGVAPELIIQCPCDELFGEAGLLQSFKMFECHQEGYSWAYRFFEEERSRQTVVGRMRMYLLGHAVPLNTLCDTYYEDGFVPLGKNEIFVDAGACDGDTAKQFIEKVQKAGGSYSRVYSFEPSASNYEQTVRCLSGYQNVEILNKGLWSYDAELTFFEGLASSSALVTTGVVIGGNEVCVPVTSLDAVLKHKSDSELPTFIKMDIEGSEKEALLGAADTIRRAKPKLAICAYHKPEDIYELPQTILNIRDDYKLVLRQHEPNVFVETILYAI